MTQHDVIAFLSAWADNTEPREAAAYVHFGMTSSDLLDTALALQLVEATDILLAKADALVAALRDLGMAHKDTVQGRPHPRHPRRADDLGAPGRRHRLRDGAQPRPAQAGPRRRGDREDLRCGRDLLQHRPATSRQAVAERLGLKPTDAATQVVIRDGISEWVSALAIIATVCEAFALEVRHGQRTEVREL